MYCMYHRRFVCKYKCNVTMYNRTFSCICNCNGPKKFLLQFRLLQTCLLSCKYEYFVALYHIIWFCEYGRILFCTAEFAPASMDAILLLFKFNLQLWMQCSLVCHITFSCKYGDTIDFHLRRFSFKYEGVLLCTTEVVI